MRKFLLFLLGSAALTAAHGDVSLPSLVSDNMLLQRSNAVVFGSATPGEKVKVTLGKSSASTVTGKDGKWRVKLDGLKPGVAGNMTVTGKNKLTVLNVAVGEVWLCAGQSNMQFPVCAVLKAQEEMTTADSPEIRMFCVARNSSDSRVEEVQGKWEVCDPDIVGHWSAVGYFFARQLRDDLEIPVGMINSSRAGAPAQAWTERAVLEADPQLATYCEQWKDLVAAYPAAKDAYEKAMAEWKVVAESAKTTGKPTPRPPFPPAEPGSARSPGAVYNAMIRPLSVWPVKGVIWYQGESNVRDAARYRKLFPAMIASWRKAWNAPELPFFYAQIAGFLPRRELPVDSDWAELREAQRLALGTPNTAMAVTVDIGDPARLHPRNKQEVGRRLAVAAESFVYGKEITGAGPLFEGAKFAGDTITVSFKPGTARGLLTRDHEAIKGFAVAGEDRKFVWANAEIVGGDPVDHTGTLSVKTAVSGKTGKKGKAKAPAIPEQTVTVSSLAVPKPVALRYAWADNPEVNLVNKAGLPASPFRTDNWPQEPPPPQPVATPTPTPSPS